MKENALNFKGYPLTRFNNQIYYGKMSDKFIAFIQILQTETKSDTSVGNKIFVQLLSTDTTLPPAKRIINQTDKHNILNALEIANVWLQKAIANA
ncbi:MAG: hypothetical protein ACRCZK_05395 [Oscillospiraceae bacterium]